MKTNLRRAALALLLLPAATCVATGSARAEVIVKGTGEPAFTNSANNTQWVEWSNNGNYRVEFNHHVNGGNAVVDGPYQVAKTGSTPVDWAGISGVTLPLKEGSTYTICGFGRWDDGTGWYFPDFSTSCGDADRRGLRASTTIDRTAPTIGVALASGRAAVNDPKLPLRIDFSDNLAGPFPANFLCMQYGGNPSAVCHSEAGYKYTEQPACSVPMTSGRTSNRFECFVETAGGATPAPDGPVHVCVMSADAAIPDNPNSADQRGSSTSANRSAPVCDTVTLDRVAPTVAVTAQPGASVEAGRLVTFGAEASDATSGLSGSYQWTWGDNTQAGTGATPTHTFTATGTYEVSVKTTDLAGNETVAKKVITVTPKTAEPPPTPGPTAPVVPGGEPVNLTVSAPAKVVARKKASVPVTLTTDTAGQATLALIRGGKVVAQAGAALVPGTNTARLTLPRRARAGAHQIEVVLTPAGGTPVTRSATVKVVGARKARKPRRARAAATDSVAGHSAPTLPGDLDVPRRARLARL